MIFLLFITRTLWFFWCIWVRLYIYADCAFFIIIYLFFVSIFFYRFFWDNHTIVVSTQRLFSCWWLLYFFLSFFILSVFLGWQSDFLIIFVSLLSLPLYLYLPFYQFARVLWDTLWTKQNNQKYYRKLLECVCGVLVLNIFKVESIAFETEEMSLWFFIDRFCCEYVIRWYVLKINKNWFLVMMRSLIFNGNEYCPNCTGKYPQIANIVNCDKKIYSFSI